MVRICYINCEIDHENCTDDHENCTDFLYKSYNDLVISYSIECSIYMYINRARKSSFLQTLENNFTVWPVNMILIFSNDLVCELFVDLVLFPFNVYEYVGTERSKHMLSQVKVIY